MFPRPSGGFKPEVVEPASSTTSPPVAILSATDGHIVSPTSGLIHPLFLQIMSMARIDISKFIGIYKFYIIEMESYSFSVKTPFLLVFYP